MEQINKKSPLVEITGLTKRYAKNKEDAIKDITFSVCPGEIVGLVGHNGAGKSTTLKCLTGMLQYNAGDIKVGGFDMKKQSTKAKTLMSFVSDNHAVFQRMTGYEYITFVANIYNVPKQDRKERITNLNNLFKLGDSINNLISSYSHGMKQKVCMMASLIHNPKVWILDEPMLGLDPTVINDVLDFMRDYVKEGNAIIFSSHNLAVVKRVCNRVVVIKKGRLAGDISLLDNEIDLETFFMDEESTYSDFVNKKSNVLEEGKNIE